MYTIEAVENGVRVTGALYQDDRDGRFNDLDEAIRAAQHCVEIWRQSTLPEHRQEWRIEVLDEGDWTVAIVEAM